MVVSFSYPCSLGGRSRQAHRRSWWFLNSIQKTLIIPQGAILLWSWRAHKKYIKLREQYNKQKSVLLFFFHLPMFSKGQKQTGPQKIMVVSFTYPCSLRGRSTGPQKTMVVSFTYPCSLGGRSKQSPRKIMQWWFHLPTHVL